MKRMSMRAAAVAVCAAGALLSGACSFAPRFETPRLSIVGVQLLGADLIEQRLRVRMRVENPNARALPVGGIEYTIELDGERFASGVSDTSFVVPANGEAQFDMSVTTNLAGTLLRLLARAGHAPGGEVPYHIRGKVSLSSGWLRSIPFEERGSFRLQ